MYKNKKPMKHKNLATKLFFVFFRTIIAVIIILGLYLSAAFASYQYQAIDESVYVETNIHETKPTETEIEGTLLEMTDTTPTADNKVEEPKKEVKSDFRNILIIGIDARQQTNLSGGKGSNSDVMIIASINNKTGEIKLVSILRDEIMKMEAGTKAFNKANAQFPKTNISDTVSMVNRNLGLDITEYVVVNWYGVAKFIDQIGGVEITIPNDDVVFYFNGYLTEVCQNTGIWGQQLSAPGTYLMNGVQAVSFCRIRYCGYNDTGRTLHQRETIQKILEKTKDQLKHGNIMAVIDAASTACQNCASNITLKDVLKEIGNLNKYYISETRQFPEHYLPGNRLNRLNATYGIASAIAPQDFEQEVVNLHYFLFEEWYDPSDEIQMISDHLKTLID